MGDARDLSFRLLFDANPTPMWVFDRETLRFVVVNDAAIARYGYTREELLGMTILDIRPDGEVEEFAGFIRERLLNAPEGFNSGTRWKHRTKSGEAFEVFVHVAPVMFMGRPGALAVVRDVSEQMRAERARDRSRDRLEYLLSATRVVTYTLELRNGTRTTFISKSIERVLGHAAESFLADPQFWRRHIHPDDLSSVGAAIDSMERSDDFVVEYRFRHADGTWRWMVDEGKVVRDAEGQPREIVGSWIDITSRKAAEEGMRRSEKSFRTLIERAPSAILVHRRDEIVYVNASGIALLGYQTAGELLGRPPLDIVHPDDRERVRQGLTRTATQSGSGPVQLRLIRRDGRVIVVEGEGVLFELDGEPSHVVLARDLSERHEMFARIAAAERMVSVGTLAAGVAHEINNPLAFVISNLALIERALVSPERTQSPRLTSADVATLLRDAGEGASRVATIVRELRSLSRAEPENEARGTVDIRRALQFSLKMAETQTLSRARVVAELEADLPLVDADEPRVGQVFLNLLVNAAQAISSGSAQDNEIRVRARATPDRSAVVVEVVDTGEGIPESLHARIFDPFFTTKPVGVATGLGLAICHGIVKRFGGQIALVSSAPGQGTHIRVTLPAAATHPSKPAPSPRTSRRGELRARVLLVDDEPSLGRTVQLLLQPEHDVVTVVHARHAIELLERGERFDVILCDLMMPEMSGIDFHAHIASSSPTLLERIVFLTGGAFTDQTRAFLAGLPNPTIEKPFSEASLRDAISRALT